MVPTANPSYVPPPQCQPGEFACANSRCIQERWKCDGDNDCLDNSDEAPALCRESPPSHPGWPGRAPVPEEDRDLETRPDPLTDPLICPPSPDQHTCPSDRFKCENNRCIPNRWLCDGDNDCGNSEDESNATCSGMEGIGAPQTGSQAWGSQGSLGRERKEPVCSEQRGGTLGRRWGLPFPARMDRPTELGLRGSGYNSRWR